jgi:2-keto-3-deoxy-L-rhamnonate aldolase RhmA
MRPNHTKRLLGQGRPATGTAAGIQVFNAQAANPRIEQGFRFVSVMSEFEMVRDAAAEVLRSVSSFAGKPRGIEG